MRPCGAPSSSSSASRAASSRWCWSPSRSRSRRSTSTRFAEPLAARVQRRDRTHGRDRRSDRAEPVARADAAHRQDVALGNAPWGSAPALLKVGRVEAQVALLPLLHRRFEIVRVTLVDPVISLETDAQGHGNWVVRRTAATPRRRRPGSAVVAGPALGIASSRCATARVIYRDGASGDVTPRADRDAHAALARCRARRSPASSAAASTAFRSRSRATSARARRCRRSSGRIRCELVGHDRRAQCDARDASSRRARGTQRARRARAGVRRPRAAGHASPSIAAARVRATSSTCACRGSCREALALPAVAAGAGQARHAACAARGSVAPRRVRPAAAARALARGRRARARSPSTRRLAARRSRSRNGDAALHAAGRAPRRRRASAAAGSAARCSCAASCARRTMRRKGATLDLHVEGRELDLRSPARAVRRAARGDRRQDARHVRRQGERRVVARLGRDPRRNRAAARRPGAAARSAGQLDRRRSTSWVLPSIRFATQTGGTDLRCARRAPADAERRRARRALDRDARPPSSASRRAAPSTFATRRSISALRPQLRSGIPIDVARIAGLVRVHGPFDQSADRASTRRSRPRPIARIGARSAPADGRCSARR